jgi:hypothetical protein
MRVSKELAQNRENPIVILRKRRGNPHEAASEPRIVENFEKHPPRNQLVAELGRVDRPEVGQEKIGQER